jgi:hypothetical protein
MNTFKWSTRADGFGFYYGFASQDHRQMNVRRVVVLESQIQTIRCEAFVGGVFVGEYDTIAEAQVGCEEYIKGNPP